MRRRQGASRTAAIVDAVFWPRPDVPYLSVRLGLRPWAIRTLGIYVAGALGGALVFLVVAAALAASVGVTVVVPGGGTTADVCPSGCRYATIGAAVSAAAANATINVKGGTYNECFEITSSKSGLTLVGVGGMVKMPGKVCQGKGIIIDSGLNTTIKNVEFYNASTQENAAGVRGQGNGTLTLDNVYIHDNDEGILGGSPTTIIRNSTFNNNGYQAGALAHNLYIGVADLQFINSVSTHAKQEGHEFKTRSKKTTITCSILGTQDGLDSYTVDIPDGGSFTAFNSVFEKGKNTNSSGTVVYAAESLGNGAGPIVATGNIAISDTGSNVPFVRMARAPTSANVSGNTLVNSVASSGSASTGTNTSFASRAAAGMAAYPALPALPAACGGIVPGYDPARAQ